ncbi:ribosomal protein large subunit L15 [Thermoplasma volcanium GSS1]|uniref:Large ribosomal subunit protein eL15 n=1 Tax=Thermoplasma volcanium (strain ATCC 51530 / DSM 4299 / JCM 9571 / NBRC 15438 / GSS1) TaxID=273116 RepID=RL15E_THEVO|nr:50S ribosomal protein L15e [Thermoplasma volcanium]Q97BC1.1 RecName: Full=Large ribosomal subunit protein eL15; AltName: Full=50S ribosomal protein L15e [Thermoplasma volcanium GSS1]BAB59677.1 ribosomal protein large subunit L15 [Thermoplasma volcanium GSS1]
MSFTNLYQEIREEWKSLKKSEIYDVEKSRMIGWRHGPSVVRLDHPTRIDRARALGYKSKDGFIVVRSRVRRGGSNREKIMGGRRPRRLAYNKLTRKKSLKLIAEERAADKYPNLEVLNSYYVGEDGLYKYYEVILVDKSHPNIYNDPHISWISEPQNTGRVYRGLTSAGYKVRGLRTGRKGSSKSRPSIRANGRLRR